METEPRPIGDFKEILKRRKWIIILPAVIVFLIAAIVAFALPPVYRSTATILIEEQEIPKEYAMSMVTSYVEQRIQTYNQLIMSSSRLIEIINRFNLYADLRKRRTIEEVIEEMRNDIKFQTISPQVIDRRTGRRTAATIAFSVSYEGEKPNVVQQVANVLASLYLEENLKVREEKTAGASRFVEEELARVQGSLAAQDAKIAAYKQKHINSLPELSQMNLQELDRLERTIEQSEIQLRSVKEREGALQTQLAGISPLLAAPDKDRLKELRAKLVFLKTRYSDQYPDMIKTKAEIAELEARLHVSGKESPPDKPDNPAYISIATQLSSAQLEIDSLKKQIAVAEQKKEEYRQRIQSGPRVEEGYKALMGERNNLQAKYDDLMKKHMETQVASELEKEQLAERFTLIDPPRLPEKPVRPNRPAVLLIGLFLGIGSGVALVFLKEFMDQSVRSVEAFTRATGLTVLASIPEILTFQEIARTRKRRVAVVISILLLIIVGVLVFHFFIMDLDVFWARLARRLDL
jgi:polysaccharide chain length determinant protein (PEP-CTERM system associated)